MSQAGLLQYYAGLGRLAGTGLERTALRAESVHMREILAHLATAGRCSFSELVQGVRLGGSLDEVSDYAAAASLAWVVALQNSEEHDTSVATGLLEQVLPHWDRAEVPDYRYHRLLAELYFEQGDSAALKSLLAEFPGVRRYFHGYIPVDAQNPFVAGSSAGSSSYERWLSGFNRMFTENGLMPVHLDPGPGEPFNRLRTHEGPTAGEQGPRVTVIMTSYKPVRDDIIQSARSILNQTWVDLELLVVDDASPEEYASTLDDLRQLDPRVKLIRLDTNGGTYRARNVALHAATGSFVTGQDADDWSHPQRIETQVKHLLNHPETPGNQVYTVNISSDLVRIRRGYHPFIPSAPTLMVRTEIMRELGGYLPARKAADNELRGRVAAYTGSKVEAIRLPLILMRILPDSLSRADFRPGWQHPARRAFWSAYRTWHRTASRQDLQAGGSEAFPIHVPARFIQPPTESISTDVVLLADLCGYGAVQVSLVDEIRALTKAGLRVGVMHSENAHHLSSGARQYHQPLQEMISAGTITHVLADEEFHRVRLLLVRSPEILQFMPRGSSAFSPERLWVAVQSLPGGNPTTYLPQTCAQHAEAYFGMRPEWVATSTAAQQRLAEHLPIAEVRPEIYRAPFDPRPYRAARRRRRSLRPVIGRWAGQLPEDWPAEPSVSDLLWPTDGSAEVRLYGDATNAARIVHGGELPAEWVAFQVGDISRRTYYRSLDFFVHYPSADVVAPERPVLEALAGGCVVLLPPSHRRIYGEAALYGEPSEIPDLVHRYWNDGELYGRQSQRAAAFSSESDEQEFAQMVVSAATAGMSSGKAASSSS